MYRFERKTHDFLLNVLFQGDPNLFSRSHILDQQYLTCLSDCKNLLFQVMMFIEFFPMIHIIVRVKIFHNNEKNLLLSSWLENPYELKNCCFNFSSNVD